MNEDKSNNRINPRLRNTQRVRAVPYECCGGLCSVLNSGCFSMCCGKTKTKKKSGSYRKKSDDNVLNKTKQQEQQVSETSKKLIRPNSTDGITEVEQNALKDHDDFFHDDFNAETNYEKNPYKHLDYEKDSAFSLTDDNLSAFADEHCMICDGTPEPKKSQMNLSRSEKLGEMSESDSKLSIPKSVVSDKGTANKNATGSLNNSSKFSEHHSSSPSFVEKCTVQSQQIENIDLEEKDANVSKKKKFFSKISLSKGKKNEVVDNTSVPREIDESDLIHVAKISNLGATAKRNEAKQDKEKEASVKELPQVNEKKSLFKKIGSITKTKKGKENEKTKDDSSPLVSEQNKPTSKKTLLGKLSSMKPSKSRSTPENEQKQIRSSTDVKEKKNKTLFGAIKMTKKTDTIKKEKSEDSSEMKNETKERETTPITIVRNDFFPTEVRYNSDHDSLPDGNASVQELGENENEKELCDVGDENEPEMIKNEESSAISQDDIRGIETLHVSLKDRDVLPTLDSPTFTTVSLPEIPNKFQENQAESVSTNGVFHSSCRLSIEGSTDEQQECNTLMNSPISSTVDNFLQQSTDTLTEAHIETNTNEWIEIPTDNINDATFDHIHESTLKYVEHNETNIEEEQSLERSCEKCGNIFKENELIENETVKCICGTLTRIRPSVAELQEGNVKDKIAAFSQNGLPIIIPIDWKDSTKVTRKDDAIISEAHSSPTLGTKSGNKSATPSPIITAKSRSGTLSSTNSDWQNAEGDIDRLMTMQGRSSLSSLGLRSDSMASVYSGAGEGRYGTVTVKGHVEFGLQYNYKAGDLEIHIKQCKDLAPVDIKRNRSDPYVKVYLLPDKSKSGKRKTKVKKHTLNPIFEETLKFHISLNGLETRTLWLTVWHSDMFGRNDFLGEVMMTLENKVFDDPSPKLYNLQERTEPFDDTISFKGDIIVCLKFVPPDMTVQKKGKRSRGTLHVLVKEAKCLTAYKANGTSDPFCKSYLLPDKGRNSKQKTQVMKKTVNPVWNHTFVYDDVTLQELSERCLELTVWDHDRLASNEFLGGVRFSLGTGKHYGKSVEWMDSTGKEISLWKSMLERPNFWVEGCLSLRPTLEARSS